MRLAKFATAAAVGVLVLILASAALANPAVDEYKLRLPDAKGKDHDQNGADPTPTLGALPAPTVEGLRHNKNGKALAAVATAPDLGAPQPMRENTDGDDSLLSGLFRSLLDPLALLVLLGMAAIAIGGYRLRRLDQIAGGRRPARSRASAARR